MGRAQRRKQENRQRRLEEARAAEQTRAARRRYLMIALPALAALAAAALFLILSRDPAGDDTVALDSATTTSPDAVMEDSVPEPELAESLDPPADTLASSVDTSPAPEGSEQPVGDDTSVPSSVSPPEGCPATDGSDGRRIDFEGPHPMCIDPAARYTAVFDTSEGEIRFELTPADTPRTVNNFVTLARWGYYDGTLLFRTDPSIDIIQGGSPHTNSPSDSGPGYNIPDEPQFEMDPDTGQPVGPYRYQPGQLVMARSSGFDSGSAQFFITTGPDAALLDSQGIYVVFGVTDEAGLAVARSIMDLHTPTGALGGAPSRDVIVRSVTIEESTGP